MRNSIPFKSEYLLDPSLALPAETTVCLSLTLRSFHFLENSSNTSSTCVEDHPTILEHDKMDVSSQLKFRLLYPPGKYYFYSRLQNRLNNKKIPIVPTGI